MKFFHLAQYFEKIESTSLRLKITTILADLFDKLTPAELKKTIYLLQGRVVPLYEKIEFGMAEKMIIKSVILALNLEKDYFLSRYKKIGDLGQTVEEFKKEIRSFEEKELSVLEVYESLYKLAIVSGDGSQETKIKILANLIRQLDPLSCRYIVRIPAGIMRLGFSDMTILDAFSWLIKKDKSLRGIIEKAYHVRPDLGYIGEVIKEKGVEGLTKISPQVLTPILMMRAERLSSSQEILEKIGCCAIEEKFDGFRLQIHYQKKDSKVKLFSRNLEEVTFMYPDIVEAVKKEIGAEEIIFEGEAVGFEPQSNSFLPFQETVQRKRKYGIEEKAKEIPLKVFAFELLYFNGKSYLNKPFFKRRERLEEIVINKEKDFEKTIFLANQKIVEKEKEINLFFDEAITKGLEGIVAKKLDGVYQPGARGWNWVKFKRSYSSKIEDTIDCLVMGYDLGKGKRASFGIGAFLVGVYDEKEDKFVTVAKIGTGLSDEEWKNLKVQSLKFKVQKKPNQYEVDKTIECDVWLAPSIIVEIRADEITRSPVHTAGRRLKPSKSGSALEVDVPGFALRFPRLERFREDKKIDEVTTLKELENLFNRQKK
ncbi:MAG: ATP-dependent DNA ligase [Patescibacteria group bacterium]|nr:ATP-dependent DNA ligase [Patescibacteria group bacterium]